MSCSCKEAAKYADENGFLHIETSAKSDTNIDELFGLVSRTFMLFKLVSNAD